MFLHLYQKTLFFLVVKENVVSRGANGKVSSDKWGSQRQALFPVMLKNSSPFPQPAECSIPQVTVANGFGFDSEFFPRIPPISSVFIVNENIDLLLLHNCVVHVSLQGSSCFCSPCLSCLPHEYHKNTNTSLIYS